METEYFIFPLRNEAGFTVNSIAAYNQLLYHVMNATTQLAEEYPDKKILVVYEADSGINYEKQE